MIGKRASVMAVAALLLAAPGLAQEVSGTPRQKAELRAPWLAHAQEQAAGRKICGSRRSPGKRVSLPSNCSAGALCPVW